MTAEFADQAKHAKKSRKSRAGIVVSLLSMVTYLGVWVAISADGFELISDFKFPSPSTVYYSAVDVGLLTMANNMWVTWRRVLEGLALGTSIGVGVGLLMGYSHTVEAALDPIIESWRPIPAIAMMPFILLWFGIEEIGKLLLIVLGVAMILLVSTREAVRNVPPIYLNASRTLGATKVRTYFSVVVPRMVLDIIGPFRVALALSFTLVVAAELMGSQAGLGFMLANARRSLNTGVIFLAVFSFGILSSVTDKVVRRIMAHLTRWSERSVDNPVR